MLAGSDAAFATGVTFIAIGVLLALTKWAWRDNNIFKLLGAVVLLKLLFGRRGNNHDEF